MEYVQLDRLGMVSVMHVDAHEQLVQGGRLNAFYTVALKGKKGRPFLVAVIDTPIQNMTGGVLSGEEQAAYEDVF